MGGEERVAWREGLFLRPQHFQQQDRHIDAYVRARTAHLRPYPWGLVEIALNGSLAASGKFGVERCAGVMPDGTPFAIPDRQPMPAPLDIPADTRDAVVYLTLAPPHGGASEFAAPEDARAVTRFVVDERQVFDAFSGERAAEAIEVARPAFRFGVTRDQIEGRDRIGLARVREVLNGQVIFDDRYIPPALDLRATRLTGFITELQGRSEQYVDRLSVQAVESTEGGSSSWASFLMLMALNRWSPALAHLLGLPSVHPERLFETLAAMAGELATLTRTDRRPPRLPAYDHENLQACFDPLYELLQQELSAGFDASAEPMDLKLLRPGSYAATITDRDRDRFRRDSFFLVVSARVPLEEIRTRFPKITKVGSTLKMPQIVGESRLPGVAISHAPTLPPQLRALAGHVYFELDRHSPDWGDFATAPGLGVHVAGEWPELKLELWWVKRQRS